MALRSLLLIILPLLCLPSRGQQKITYSARDGVQITAELLKSKNSDPYVLFFHQAGSSRGEYADIAPKIMKLAYNCLVVDLRYGAKEGYVPNLTAADAHAKGLEPLPYDAMLDIRASVQKAWDLSHKPVILFGSSFSASLCLICASDNDRVSAVVACSPGEYFDHLSVQDSIRKLDIPLFITASRKEAPYVKKLLSGISPSLITNYISTKDNDLHGARIFGKENQSSDEAWLALLLFFRELSQNQ